MSSNMTIGSALTTGWLGQGINGSFRIPALAAAFVTAGVAGEISLRIINETVGRVFRLNDGKWLETFISQDTRAKIRPYGRTNAQGEYLISGKELLVQLVGLAAVTIFAVEVTRKLCGPMPAFYNTALTFLGPVRLDPNPYIDNVRHIIGR